MSDAQKNVEAKGTLRKLLASLKMVQAESELETVAKVAETEAATKIGEGAPGQADSLDQGEEAGSNTAAISTTPAEQVETANTPGNQELGEDPSTGEAPAVKDDKSFINEAAAGDSPPDLVKQAEAMTVEADLLLRQAATEVVVQLMLRKRAEAVEGVAGDIASELGVDEETAAAISEGLANGEIDPAELESVAAEAPMVFELAEKLGAEPEAILQAAADITEKAGAEGLTGDDIVDSALAAHTAASEIAEIKAARLTFDQLGEVLKQAESENDKFTVQVTRGRRNSIIKSLGGDLTGHLAETPPEDDTSDVPPESGGGEEGTPVGGEASAADVDPAEAGDGGEESEEDAATAGSDLAGEEQMAAAMLNANVPSDEIEVAQEAIQDLIDGDIPIEVIQEMVSNELTPGASEELLKTASADDHSTDPLVIATDYLRAAVHNHRLQKQAATAGVQS